LEVKASKAPILREKMKMDTLAPVEGMNGTILKIRTMRNANQNWGMQIGMQTLGGPPLCGRGWGKKNGWNKHKRRKLDWENASAPPILLVGGWNFFAVSIWKSGILQTTLWIKIFLISP